MKANFPEIIAVLSAVTFSLCGWGLILLEISSRLHYPVMI